MNLHAQNARVIDAAADRIHERGWFRLGESQSPGAECAYIAIAIASLGFPDVRGGAALLAMSEYVDQEVTHWNDAQSDADTVIAKLRECADAERAKAWESVPA